MKKIEITFNEKGTGTLYDWIGDVVASWNDDQGKVIIQSRTTDEWLSMAKDEQEGIAEIKIVEE